MCCIYNTGLDREDFLALCLARLGTNPVLISNIRQYFDELDVDRNGIIDHEELSTQLSMDTTGGDTIFKSIKTKIDSVAAKISFDGTRGSFDRGVRRILGRNTNTAHKIKIIPVESNMNQDENSRENARENKNARTRSDNSVNSIPFTSEKDDACVASLTTTAELSTYQSSEEEGQERDRDGHGDGRRNNDGGSEGGNGG